MWKGIVNGTMYGSSGCAWCFENPIICVSCLLLCSYSVQNYPLVLEYTTVQLRNYFIHISRYCMSINNVMIEKNETQFAICFQNALVWHF
jgi:hypothetical protein